MANLIISTRIIIVSTSKSRRGGIRFIKLLFVKRFFAACPRLFFGIKYTRIKRIRIIIHLL